MVVQHGGSRYFPCFLPHLAVILQETINPADEADLARTFLRDCQHLASFSQSKSVRLIQLRALPVAASCLPVAGDQEQPRALGRQQVDTVRAPVSDEDVSSPIHCQATRRADGQPPILLPVGHCSFAHQGLPSVLLHLVEEHAAVEVGEEDVAMLVAGKGTGLSQRKRARVQHPHAIPTDLPQGSLLRIRHEERAGRMGGDSSRRGDGPLQGHRRDAGVRARQVDLSDRTVERVGHKQTSISPHRQTRRAVESAEMTSGVVQA
mmetsp:Transcript_36306/g.81781  ORF Transcript_36306/g.81781 Transcript_36306/m.81781 type:complete len:263 (-) Transcript_36306:390-1178(-)